MKDLMQHALNHSENVPDLKKPVKSERIGQCEKCRGNITQITFEDGTTKETGCRCESIKWANDKQRRINAETFEKGSLIYGDYRKKDFDDYHPSDEQQEKALKISRYYAEHFNQQLENGQNIFFQGTYGTGKTHLAAAIRQSVASQGYKVLFMSLPDYLDTLKREFKERNLRHPISKMAKDAELLILDDVGANRMTDFAHEELFKIVDSRRGKCTIYTTNYTSEQFKGNQELQRIFSRMMENTKAVVLNGTDYRMKGLM